MPDLVVAAVAWAGEAAIGAGLGDIGVALIMNSELVATGLQVVAAVYTLREQQRRAENRAKDAYNASQRDRYAMVRGSLEPRQLVLGRQRVSGPVGYIGSYGTYREHLVFTVVMSAHELDAVETVYFSNEPVVLDGSGNVLGIQRTDQFSISAASATVSLSSKPKSGTVAATALYGTTSVSLTIGTITGTSVTVSGAHSGETGLLAVTYQPDPCPFVPTTTATNSQTFTAGGTGTDVFTISTPAVAGSLSAVQTVGSGDSRSDASLGVSASGTSVTVTGAVSGPVVVAYQSSGAVSRARVRSYLGAPGQTADAGMISNLPGIWTSAHTGTGLGYLVVELDYDQVAFPSGIPQVSAIVRGIKCYDPRTGTTAWSENPALLLRAYALHPLGGRMTVDQIDDDSIATAATVCDTPTDYTVGGKVYTRALYTAGTVARSGTRPADIFTELCQAMGGRWCIVDGKLRVKAGSYVAPVMALDESWLHEGGNLVLQPDRTRADVINAVTGTFADQADGYKVKPFPKVAPAVYVAQDRAELPADMPMPAVTFAGQAQHIAECQVRYARYGGTIKVTCNMRAYQCEPFDVITVTLAPMGAAGELYEVLDTSWTIDGGIELTLKRIDPSIWVMSSDFEAVGPSPNTRLPSPWGIPVVAGLSAVSNTSTLQKQADGSLGSRILASWTAITDQRVTQNGSVEIRWGLATDPESQWNTVLCAGNTTSTYLAPVHTGSTYLIKARTTTQNANSDWCGHVLCAVINTASFAGSIDFAAVTGSTKPADGATVNRITYSSSAPGSPVNGDWWVDTGVTPNVIRARVAGSWVVSSNLTTDTNQLTDGASLGQTAVWGSVSGTGKPADGATVNRITYSSSAPGSPVDGDWWVDTSTSPVVVKLRVAGAWQIGANLSTGALAQLNSVGTLQITADAATEVYVNTPSSAVTVTGQYHTPDGFNSAYNTALASITFTPSASGQANVFCDAVGQVVNGGSSADTYARWSIQDTGVAWDGWKRLETTIPANATVRFPMHTTRRFPVTGGTTYTLTMYGAKFTGADAFTVDNIEMRVEVVKR